jgi:hypothetical protein
MSGSISKQIAAVDVTNPQKASFDPFNSEIMNRIFKSDQVDKYRLVSRENTWLEFKENFNWAGISGYGRTCAAFANAKGGYIVFGVKNNPRIINGMSNGSFENIDPARITRFFSETFSPEIRWDMHTCIISTRNIGLLYIYESLEKPIISKKNNGEINDGEIYYRYHGCTERIKYQELNSIMKIERKHEQEMWLKYFKRIDRIGIRNAAILDTTDGTVVGSSGTFVIDESLIPYISFVKEGEFKETEGSPTLKLVGNVSAISDELIQPVRTVFQLKSIRTPDIVHSFLKQEKVRDPIEYIKQIAYETTGYLPIYYFVNLTGMSKRDIIKILKLTTSRSYAKRKIIERLTCEEDIKEIINRTGTEASRKKLNFKEDIIQKSIPANIPVGDLKYLFLAVKSLDISDFDVEYLLPIIRSYFDAFYESNAIGVADSMRKAICHLDIILSKN